MAAILHMAFLQAFSWMEVLYVLIEISLKVFPTDNMSAMKRFLPTESSYISNEFRVWISNHIHVSNRM